VTNGILGPGGQDLGVAAPTDPARVPGVADGLLLGRLVGGEDHLARVDDDHVIAGVEVTGVHGLVLATQEGGHLSGHPPEYEAIGIDHVPGAMDLGRFW